MPDKITDPNARYKKPDIRLISKMFLSLNFLPKLPAPKTLPISASIFTARQVTKIMIRWLKSYSAESETAIATQNAITAGFKVLIKKPEVKMAK